RDLQQPFLGRARGPSAVENRQHPYQPFDGTELVPSARRHCSPLPPGHVPPPGRSCRPRSPPVQVRRRFDVARSGPSPSSVMSSLLRVVLPMGRVTRTCPVERKEQSMEVDALAEPAERAGRRQWIGLAVLALPTLLPALDMTVLYLAL